MKKNHSAGNRLLVHNGLKSTLGGTTRKQADCPGCKILQLCAGLLVGYYHTPAYLIHNSVYNIYIIVSNVYIYMNIVLCKINYMSEFINNHQLDLLELHPQCSTLGPALRFDQ